MVRQLTSRAQVNGYRFLLRRAEHALLRRDTRMLHDPMRAQGRAAVAGAVIAALVLAGCGIYGLISPSGSVGDARILLSRAGGTYVVVEDTLHPVLNLASARLIVGAPEKPRVVGERALAGFARGPVLGIVGAPDALAAADRPDRSTWTVCEETGGDGPELTVLAGAPATSGPAPVPPDTAVLVEVGDTRHLVFAGTDGPVRARLPADSAPVEHALGLIGAPARPMSSGMLNTFPAVADLAVPQVADRGRPGPGGFRVGTVLRSESVDGSVAYHVILADGVAPIGEAAAAAVHTADPGGGGAVEVPVAAVAALPRSDRQPWSQFPPVKPRLSAPGAEPVLCRSWDRPSDGAPAQSVLLAGRGLPLPAGAVPVRIGTAGVGDAAAVHLPPGTGLFVSATGLAPASPRSESRYYISDFGVRFPVADDETAAVLGLAGPPVPAPWQVLSLLVAGPRLDRAAALTAHEGTVESAALRPGAPPPGS